MSCYQFFGNYVIWKAVHIFFLDSIIHTKKKNVIVLFARIGCQLLLRSVLLMTLKTTEFGQSWVVAEAWLLM